MRRLLLSAAAVAATVSVALPAAGSAARKLVAADQVKPVLLREINALRREHGLVPLRLSRALSAAAERHSREMAIGGFFAHESRDGSSFARRVVRYYPSRGHRTWAAGENLAWGAPDLSPALTLRVWLQSPPHRRNLLNPTWREIGIGAVHADAAPGVYGGGAATVVTADFGVRS